jgi:hypothetical protein
MNCTFLFLAVPEFPRLLRMPAEFATGQFAFRSFSTEWANLAIAGETFWAKWC